MLSACPCPPLQRCNILRLCAFDSRVSISTVIAQATTCMAIKAMAFGQFAPGIGAEANSRSGTKLTSKTTNAMVW